MKYMMLFEAFDLDLMFKQQNINSIIQNYAVAFIDERWIDNEENMPADAKGKKDKVALWYARQIKNRMEVYYTSVLSQDGGGEIDTSKTFANAMLCYSRGKVEKGLVQYKKYADDNGYHADGLSELINEYKKDVKRYASSMKSHMGEIMDYIISPARRPNQHPLNIVTASFRELYQTQRDWHENLRASGVINSTETGFIIKRYNDGFYWVDLRSNSDSAEADAMGHCATTHSATMLSLRREKDGVTSPHVTVAINYYEDEHNEEMDANKVPLYAGIGQMKGKNNSKPVERYHPYVVDLLCMDEFEFVQLDNDEYNIENDFYVSDLKDPELTIRLLETRTLLFSNCSISSLPIKPEEILDRIPNFAKTTRLISNLHYFWKNGFGKTEEELCAYITDLRIVDKQWMMVVSSIADLTNAYSDSGDSNGYASNRKTAEALWGEDEDDSFNHDNNVDFNDYDFNKLNDKHKEELIVALIKAVVAEGAEERLMNNFDIEPEGIREYLNNPRSSVEKLLAMDWVDDIKRNLDHIASYAKARADSDDMYETVTNPLKRLFGVDTFRNNGEGYLVPAPFEQIAAVDNISSLAHDPKYYKTVKMLAQYNEYYANELFEDDDRFISYEVPYYGWDGTVTDELMNDYFGDHFGDF